jgi:hypothetical protein
MTPCKTAGRRAVRWHNPRLKAIHDDVDRKKSFKVILTNWGVQATSGYKIYQPDLLGRGKSRKDSHPHLK